MEELEKTLTIKFSENISENSKREELFKKLKQFDVNHNEIRDFDHYNASVYSSFIDSNRDLIKNMMPKKEKVYKLLDNEGWLSFYDSSLVGCEYVFVLKYRLVKNDNGWRRFMPLVRVLPLDKDGKLLESINEYNLTDGYEIKINSLSEDNFIDLESTAKKSIKSLKDGELRAYERLKRKFG